MCGIRRLFVFMGVFVARVGGLFWFVREAGNV